MHLFVIVNPSFRNLGYASVNNYLSCLLCHIQWYISELNGCPYKIDVQTLVIDNGPINYSRADNFPADWNRCSGSHISPHQNPQMMQQYDHSPHYNQSRMGMHKADDVPESSSSNMCRLSNSANMGDFFDDTNINNPQMPLQPDDGPAIPDIIHDIVASDIDIPDMPAVIEPRPLRQSHRARKHPSWMTDFVTNVASTSSLHPLSQSRIAPPRNEARNEAWYLNSMNGKNRGPKHMMESKPTSRWKICAATIITKTGECSSF
ncbi:hypothetical protein H5410_056233 [Solanum commersonii]|uniref:Uncharacterized protein n=1 Tax=Solanum commersonii TaxID=4109 RepID=A0A9J5WJP9_SOLCO|nr:hypothetical protein H5410_056233 [Solanum commersonii]